MIHAAVANGYKCVSEFLVKEYGETPELSSDEDIDDDDTAWYSGQTIDEQFILLILHNFYFIIIIFFVFKIFFYIQEFFFVFKIFFIFKNFFCI